MPRNRVQHQKGLSAGIPQIDWAGRTEGRGNAGQTADLFFHPSGPSGFSYLILPKSLISLSKLTRGAGRTPFHPGNPGHVIRRGPSELTPHSPDEVGILSALATIMV